MSSKKKVPVKAKTVGKAVPRQVFGKGGKATLKKYGKGHFSKLAKIGHAKRKKAKMAAEKAKKAVAPKKRA